MSTNIPATPHASNTFAGGHPTLTELAAIQLKPAVFYYCGSELSAGRPCPIKLTGEQLAYIERWVAR